MSREKEVALDFATKIYEKFKEVVKSVVLFGSTAKETSKEKSDLDIIIIVDDCTVQWDQELIAWYRQELGNLVLKLKYEKKFHINTVTMSTFWNQILVGDPVVINVVRYGIPLIDFGGFFNPLKVLLAQGRIKPTPESIYTALNRAPIHLSRAKYSILAAIEACYWAMVDSAHAALMAAKKTPPSPEHITAMLSETFVKEGNLKQKYVDWFKEIYALAHYVSHGEVADVSGKELGEYRERADQFVGEMARIVKELE